MFGPTPPLPSLREDLRLFEAAASTSGERNWVIYDPVRHRYFQISDRIFEVISHWRSELPSKFLAYLNKTQPHTYSPDELQDIITFLSANNLTDQPISGNAADYAEQILGTRKPLLHQIIHKYLFFKVPLVRPQKFLGATMPIVDVFYSRTMLWVTVFFTLAGLYLTSRQWEKFVVTFLDFISWQGLIAYGASLIVVKLFHELGHAYTATRYGIRVNTMGVAFILLTPLFFTDVSDAWRLQSRKQKLAINGAGMVVELAIAGFATFWWAFLPDGPARSAAFAVATTSWVMSLLVNLNPFMRFDGYYLMADAWNVPNLQTRSFAMAKWALREFLFGLGHPCPENLKRSTRRGFIIYAFCVWIYRFFLFLGIALLVYHLFFKVLGVILFTVEIAWFIALPIFKEIMEWWKMRDEIMKSPRTKITAAVVGVVLLATFYPWSGTIRFPAVMIAERETTIFSPRPAVVHSIDTENGAAVKAGDVLAVLKDPDLSFNVKQTERKIALLRARLARIAGDTKDRSEREIILSEIESKKEELDGLKDELERLTIRAPFAGTVRDIDPKLAKGQWTNHERPIVSVVAPQTFEATGYVDEDDLWRVEVGQDALFVPEDIQLSKQKGSLVEVARAGAQALEYPYLSSTYGGAIASETEEDGQIRPRSGYYLVRIAMNGKAPQHVARGTVHVTGKPESIAASAWRRILQVLVRESGV